jgi:hypothetical protein
VWGWAEQGFSQWVLDRFPERSAFCASGGERAEESDPLSPGGYFGRRRRGAPRRWHVHGSRSHERRAQAAKPQPMR